jgi:predicted RNase H-like HicB family nuclease
MKFTFTTAIHKEGGWFVAQCVELGVASQGRTINEAKKNLKEAVELYLDDVPTKDVPREASIIERLEITHT